MIKKFLSLSLLASFSLASSDLCMSIYKTGDFKKASDCFIKQTKQNNSASNNFFTGDSLLEQGRFIEAQPYLEKAEELEQKEDKLSDIYNRLSLVYSSLGNRDLEYKYDMKYLNTNLKLNNLDEVSVAYSNLGLFYSKQGNKQEALNNYFKSLDLKGEKENGTTLSNIATVYTSLEQFDNAIDFYNKAIDRYSYFQDNKGICLAKTNLGSLYYTISFLQQANDSLFAANSICHEINFIPNEANSFILLGLTALKQHKVDAAKVFYKQAEPLAKKSGDNTILNNLKVLENSLNSF